MSRTPQGVSVGGVEPSTWIAASQAAQRAGDTQALQATPVPGLDRLCGKNANGVQGRMYCQGGVCFCRWD